MEQRSFNQLLAAAAKNGASDVHVRAGAPPAMRINGTLVPVKAAAVTPEDTERVVGYVLAGWTGDLAALQDLDTSYQLADVGRFRVNIFRAKGALGLVLRAIPPVVPTLDQLGLPPVIKKICDKQRGLVIVAGATGAGKSSTLAAMVDYLNGISREHILTIEDPIEFIHVDRVARITQREVGSDATNFADALRSALRQDPDTILVGEIRDLETIDFAMKAAETGHLVLTTLHTEDTAKTIGRMVDLYPHEAHQGVRARLAENLNAIICQRLLPRAGTKGRVAALEILVVTQMIRGYIREDKIGEIPDYLSKNTDVYGTQSFDQHLSELHKAGIITVDTARAAASNPSNFERALAFE